MKSPFLLIILGIIISISSFSLLNDYAVRQQTDEASDFVLAVQNVSTNPIVTKFLIRDEVYTNFVL